MHGWLHVLTLSVALSLDGVGVGVSYALAGIRARAAALLAVGVCSALLFGLSMGVGDTLLRRLGGGTWLEGHARTVGGLLLVALGLYQLVGRRWRPHLVQRPQLADSDRSGTLDFREGTALGLALGMDSLAAGFGARAAGFPMWAVPLVAAAQVAAVGLGLGLGATVYRRRRHPAGVRAAATMPRPLPGLLLVVIGLLRMR